LQWLGYENVVALLTLEYVHDWMTYFRVVVEGSLEVKLSTRWTDEKQRCEESEKRRREKIREEKESEERKCRCEKR
jgi:hypothetical protein